jgi:hypothetical protein
MKTFKVTEVIVHDYDKPIPAMTARGKGFAIRALFRLEKNDSLDVVESTITATKKKDIPAAIERHKESAKAGAMRVEFRDDMKHHFVVMKWKMGAGGMVPDGDTCDCEGETQLVIQNGARVCCDCGKPKAI